MPIGLGNPANTNVTGNGVSFNCCGNCIVVNDVFDRPVSADKPGGWYIPKSGTWGICDVIGGFADTTMFLDGGSGLLVIRPNAPTKGISASVGLAAPDGTVIRLYGDSLVSTSSDYAEVLIGSSGHIKAVSDLDSRTIPANIPAGGAAPFGDGLAAFGALIFNLSICRYDGDSTWYLTASLSGSPSLDGIPAFSVPCSEPTYGRLALEVSGASDRTYFTLLSFNGLGTGTIPFDQNEFGRTCGDCPAPDCGCDDDTLTVTLAGFPTTPPPNVNGTYTLNRSTVCAWTYPPTPGGVITIAYDSGTLTATGTGSGLTFTGTASGRGCDSIHGMVLTSPFVPGATVTIH